jgi:hypothetical protein
VLIAVGSVKGSPGATTLAVALAALWPGRQAVVVEADCAGGDLGARCWLPDAPGLASLATAARTGTVTLADHIARLPCGADVVLAPAGRQAATVAVGLLAEAATRMWASGRHIILDVGRLDPGSPSAAILEAADILLLATGGDDGSLLRLAEAGLPAVPACLVLVGGSSHPVSEVAAAVGLPVSAVLPWDERAVQVLWGERAPGPAWAQRGLPAAVRALARRLVPADPGGAQPRQGPRAIPAAAPHRAAITSRPTPATAEGAARVPAGLEAWLRAGRRAQ